MEYLTTGQVVEELGIEEPRLRDLIRRHKIAEPAARIGGRRMWTRKELNAAREVVRKNGK